MLKKQKKDNKIQNFIYFLLSFGSFNSNILRGRAKNYPPFHNLVFFFVLAATEQQQN